MQPGVEAVGPKSSVTLQATTLAQSFWELLNRTLDDELGYVHVRADGRIRWLSRTCGYRSPPVLALGCLAGVDALDIVTDVVMGAVDTQLRNAVYATRTGGEIQTVKSLPSIVAHGGLKPRCAVPISGWKPTRRQPNGRTR